MGHDGAVGELFVKGGWGRTPGRYTKTVYLREMIVQVGSKKMKFPTKNGDAGFWRTANRRVSNALAIF